LNPIPFRPIWGKEATKFINKEKKSTTIILNMWSFGRWGCARMKPILESLVLTWLIGKTSLSCCQILCPFKIQPSRKVFGVLTIGRSNHVQGGIPPIVDVDLKNLVITPYYGLKNM
jgi:hypothetical protein